MTLGPDYYYKCPCCGKILMNRSINSGNTFGAVYFSDGRRIAPMLPDFPDLTKCETCDEIIWLSDLESIGESYGKPDNPEWENANEVNNLELDDLWEALETLETLETSQKNKKKQKQRKIFIRQRIWWQYNTTRFQFINDVDDWRQNCFDLLELLNLKDNDQRCMAAELNRNICNYSKCLELIKDLPNDYASFKEKMTEECKNKNPLTVNFGEKNEKKDKKDKKGKKRESESSEKENTTKESIAARFAEKIEQDEKTAKTAMDFYIELARRCNVEAQYALGMLYLDERFYNQSEAEYWLAYAAYRGHKAAFDELEDLKGDDGRYDAYL